MRMAVAIFPEVRELLHEDPSQLDALLEEIHDEDLADLLKLLDEAEAIMLLEQLDPENAADIFERLDEHDQAEFVEHLGARRLAPIVSEMAVDERVDLIEELDEPIAEEVLDTIDPEAAAEVEALIKWDDDTAGGIMTTEYLSAPLELKVSQVIQRVREAAEEAETIYYVYAVDKNNVLKGVASLRDLLLADANELLSEIMMENLLTVQPNTDQELVARKLSKYDMTALPVTAVNGTMLGVITVDDVIDVLAEEQTEDVQKLAGVGPIEERYFHTSFWTFLAKRAPWLAILFVGQFITESMLRHYDPVIKALTQLTYYLPLLISTGGNSGAQSATLIIRGLATGDITMADWWRVAVREVSLGLVLGVALASLGVVRVLSVGGGTMMAATIGLSVVAIVLMGCSLGAMLPLLLRRLGLDPATSSTPFIATLVDVFGILLYFTIATAMLAVALG